MAPRRVLLLVLLCAPIALCAPPASAAPVHLRGGDLLVLSSDVVVGEPGADLVLEAERVVVLPGVLVEAGPGRAGLDAAGEGTVLAGAGGAGGNVVFKARVVEVHGIVRGGAGGRGGDAAAWGSDAFARGGDGGAGGLVLGAGPGAGEPGAAGAGGHAEAFGRDGGPCGGAGEDAEARAPHGGSGASAEAYGGRGGEGCADEPHGGDGGNATAFGGNGGTSGGRPGAGGGAFAIGGKGGEGEGGCTPESPRGGHGGRGGNAYAQGGNVTPGTYPASGGARGGNAFAQGGDGGDGGWRGLDEMGGSGEGGWGYAAAGTSGAAAVVGESGNGEAEFKNGVRGREGPPCSPSIQGAPAGVASPREDPPRGERPPRALEILVGATLAGALVGALLMSRRR